MSLTNGVVFDGDVTLTGGTIVATGDFAALTWNLTDDCFGNVIEAALDLSQLPDMQIDVLASDVGFQTESVLFDQSIPEPTTLVMLGLGFAGLASASRKKRLL